MYPPISSQIACGSSFPGSSGTRKIRSARFPEISPISFLRLNAFPPGVPNTTLTRLPGYSSATVSNIFSKLRPLCAKSTIAVTSPALLSYVSILPGTVTPRRLSLISETGIPIDQAAAMAATAFSTLKAPCTGRVKSSEKSGPATWK